MVNTTGMATSAFNQPLFGYVYKKSSA